MQKGGHNSNLEKLTIIDDKMLECVITAASAAPNAWSIIEGRCKLKTTIRNYQVIMYSNTTALSDAAMRESARRDGLRSFLETA